MRAKLPYWYMVLAALTLVLGGCAPNVLAIVGMAPTLYDVRVAPAVISPNGDGNDDVALVTYAIGQSADVSIYFVDAAGARYYFRQAQRRSPGKYQVYWGGVINDPQTRAVKGGSETVLSRVLPDGSYHWVVEAAGLDGHNEKAEGQIIVQQADTQLPDITNFTVVPQIFSPNQDGMRGNQVAISYYLTKKAERVQVYLENVVPAGSTASVLRYPVAEQASVTNVEPGDAGYHGYKYEGGVDLNAEPPPDGNYTVKVEAEDKVGNHTVVSTTLTLKEGGKPRAEVAGGEISWQGEMNRVVSVPLGQTLCFTATVVNIGPVPIRTAGPWPGQLYKFTENNNALALSHNDPSWFQQAGVYRFGINYDTTGIDFPYRWAIGRPEDLEKRVIDGKDQYYLLPGHRGLVSGCIQFDQKPPVGTQFWWGGLIHEFVAVENDQVNRIQVNVGAP